LTNGIASNQKASPKQKKQINRVKSQPTEWEKIFASYLSTVLTYKLSLVVHTYNLSYTESGGWRIAV
jgi:hypothetical protein